MKKILTKLMAFMSAATLSVPLAACGDGDADTIVHVYMPDGAPAIALSAMMDSGYKGTDFTVVTATEIGGLVGNGKADMAIMPINAAATLYNRGVGIVMLSVNTHGNLFIVGGDADTEIEPQELVGHTLGVIGAGNVPDLTMRMLFDEINLAYERTTEMDDGKVKGIAGKVALYYADDATGIMPLLKTGKLDYALVGEPAATNSGKPIAVDMQKEWEATFDGGYPQACLVAKSSLVKNDKAYVDGFLDTLKKSDGWAQENPDKALAAVKKHMNGTSSLTSLTPGIVKNCNIRTVSAEDMREDCTVFFEMLTKLEVGNGTTALAKVPADGFYYSAV